MVQKSSYLEAFHAVQAISHLKQQKHSANSLATYAVFLYFE